MCRGILKTGKWWLIGLLLGSQAMAAVTLRSSSATTTHDFGTKAVGSSTTEVFTLMNDNMGAPSATSTITIGTVSTSAAPFVKILDDCSGRVMTSTPTSTCTITVQYFPTASAVSNGTLTVVVGTGNYDGTQKIVSLTGTGTTGSVSLTPASYGFPSTPVNSTSTATFTVSNTASAGGGTFSVTSATVATSIGGIFTKTADGCTGINLSPGVSCTVAVTYAPDVVGEFSAGTLTVVTTASTGGTTKVASFTGTSSAINTSVKATISPSSVSFPGTAAGSSVTQIFTVSNTSTSGTLNVTSITGLAAPFILTGDSCTGNSVIAGGTCTFVVQFIPTASGSFSDSLIVATNAGDGTNKIASVVGQTSDFSLGQILFSVPTYSFNNNVKTATVQVLRTGNSTGKVTVDYTTVDGRASVADKDFEKTAGTLTWDSGDLSPKTISIPLPGTKFSESNRDFSIILSNIMGSASLGAPGASTTNGVTTTATPGVASIILYSSSSGGGGGCSASGQPDVSLGLLSSLLLLFLAFGMSARRKGW